MISEYSKRFCRMQKIYLPGDLIASNSSVKTLMTLSAVIIIPNASFGGRLTAETASLNTFLAVIGSLKGWNA